MLVKTPPLHLDVAGVLEFELVLFGVNGDRAGVIGLGGRRERGRTMDESCYTTEGAYCSQPPVLVVDSTTAASLKTRLDTGEPHSGGMRGHGFSVRFALPFRVWKKRPASRRNPRETHHCCKFQRSTGLVSNGSLHRAVVHDTGRHNGLLSSGLVQLVCLRSILER